MLIVNVSVGAVALRHGERGRLGAAAPLTVALALAVEVERDHAELAVEAVLLDLDDSVRAALEQGSEQQATAARKSERGGAVSGHPELLWHARASEQRTTHLQSSCF